MSTGSSPSTTPFPDTERLSRVGLRAELDGAVLTVTLDRPQRRNSQTPGQWHALGDLGASVPDEVRVVVVRGEGATFSAGLDTRLLGPDGVPGEDSVHDLMRGDDQHVLDTIDAYQRGFTWLGDPRFVSVAQVRGHAIGAGFQLALACDLRVVAEDALFCMKEPALGLVPDLAGTKPLVELVGYSRALEICATARFLGAEEARHLGLATAVVPGDDLEATTADLVEALLSSDAGAVRETKALLQSAGSLGLEEQRLRERQAQLRRFRALTARG
ncbi:enoyl-CoA hydratase/isomerase family protein [Nocardioides aurantiacus]|nr:enoyl-CoA hydratase/isomerase family protein [Nocardioides aurantiacus]